MTQKTPPQPSAFCGACGRALSWRLVQNITEPGEEKWDWKANPCDNPQHAKPLAWGKSYSWAKRQFDAMRAEIDSAPDFKPGKAVTA